MQAAAFRQTYGNSLHAAAGAAARTLRAGGVQAVIVAVVGWTVIELIWVIMGGWASWIHPHPPVGFLVVSLALATRATTILLVFIVLMDPHGQRWAGWGRRIDAARRAAPMFVLFLSAWGLLTGNELLRFLDHISPIDPVPDSVVRVSAYTLAAAAGGVSLGWCARRLPRLSVVAELIAIGCWGAFAYLFFYASLQISDAVSEFIRSLPPLDLSFVSVRALGVTQSDAGQLWSLDGLVPDGTFSALTDPETWSRRSAGRNWTRHILLLPLLGVATAALLDRLDNDSTQKSRPGVRGIARNARNIVRPSGPDAPRRIHAARLAHSLWLQVAGSRRRLDSVGIAVGVIAIIGGGAAILLMLGTIAGDLVDVSIDRWLGPHLPESDRLATWVELMVTALCWSGGLVISSCIAVVAYARGITMIRQAARSARRAGRI